MFVTPSRRPLFNDAATPAPTPLQMRPNAQLSQSETDLEALYAACKAMVATTGNAILQKQAWGFIITPVGSGFTIVLSARDKQRLELSLGDWHDDILSPDQISDLVNDCLAGLVRVTLVYSNNKPWKQIVEYDTPTAGWLPIYVNEFPRFSLFRRNVRKVHQKYERLVQSSTKPLLMPDD